MEFREFRLCGAPCLALDLGRGDVMILPVLLLRRRRLEINGAGSEITPLPPSLSPRRSLFRVVAH